MEAGALMVASTRRQAELEVGEWPALLIGKSHDESPIAKVVGDFQQEGRGAFWQTDGNDVAVEKDRTFMRIIMNQFSAEPHFAGIVRGSPQLRLLLGRRGDETQRVGANML